MSKTKTYVRISIDELSDLLEANARLNALEFGGVDNWEWYGESFDRYIEDDNKYKDFDDYIEDITSEERILEYYKKV